MTKRTQSPGTQFAVIYARYSSHSQNDASIEQQVADCEAFARINNLEIVKFYADRHLTGTNDKRPEFQRMLRDAERGHWQYVITWKVDRFARNRYDSATYKYRLKKHGVKVLYAKEAIPDGPEGDSAGVRTGGLSGVLFREPLPERPAGLAGEDSGGVYPSVCPSAGCYTVDC